MKRLLISPNAYADMDQIAEYVARADPVAAHRLIRSFRQAARRISQMPRIGHRRPDLTPRPVLFWSVASHLMVYRATPRGIEIVRVIHGARDVGPALGDVGEEE